MSLMDNANKIASEKKTERENAEKTAAEISAEEALCPVHDEAEAT